MIGSGLNWRSDTSDLRFYSATVIQNPDRERFNLDIVNNLSLILSHLGSVCSCKGGMWRARDVERRELVRRRSSNKSLENPPILTVFSQARLVADSWCGFLSTESGSFSLTVTLLLLTLTLPQCAFDRIFKHTWDKKECRLSLEKTTFLVTTKHINYRVCWETLTHLWASEDWLKTIQHSKLALEYQMTLAH